MNLNRIYRQIVSPVIYGIHADKAICTHATDAIEQNDFNRLFVFAFSCIHATLV